MSAVADHPTADADIAEALRDVARPLIREDSVKAIGGGLRAGRFLIGFPRHALAPGPADRLRAMADRLAMPPEAREVMQSVQNRAISVHFGHEPEPGGALTKLYLEFGPRDTPEPGLMFLAIKWRGDRWVQSRYWYRGALEAASRDALIARHVAAGPMRDLMLALSARRDCADRLIEVDEPDNPRRSVDLNLAEARLRVADHHDALKAALGGTAEAQTYLDRHARDGIGHLAAGTARDGQPFATLYHGTRMVLGEGIA